MSATGLGWRYGRGAWVFRGVDAVVEAGQLLRVAGGNGSGKSTLLRLLAGVTRPVEGSVEHRGRAVYLPQHARGLPPIRSGVLQALLAPGSAAPRSDDAGSMLASSRQTLTRRADRLSGGQARRLLLEAVLALAPHAGVVVLDEPAAGVDAPGRAALAERLGALAAEGVAVVLADHGLLPVPQDGLLDLDGTRAVDRPHPNPVEVVLRGTGELRGQHAVDGRCRLLVSETERDALLMDALADGWQVESVSPGHRTPGREDRPARRTRLGEGRRAV